MPETIDSVIIDHSHRLHKSITDGTADEFETAFPEVFAHRVRLDRGGWQLVEGVPPVLNRVRSDELPYVGAKTAILLLHLQKSPGIGHRSIDLGAIADNRRVLQALCNFACAEGSDTRRIEILEQLAITLSLIQNRGPTQTCLGPLEYQELEQGAIIILRDAPFPIVIGEV